MEFRVFEVLQDDIVFRIEEDFPKVGCYLYVVKDGKCIKDYLQNNIEACKLIVLEEYGIPLESWKSINK